MTTFDDTATRDERPWAMVTGATGGLGRAFARDLAARDYNLVLVGRREQELADLADSLTAGSGVQALCEQIDLASGGRRQTLLEELGTNGVVVDTLVNNAGFGTLGDVAALEPQRLADEVGVNCQALTELTAALLPAMLAAHRGTIVNVASTAAFQPIPGFATYAASKSYVLSFTRALWHETRGTGVRVTAICPGPIDTGFFQAAGDRHHTIPGRRRRPEQVVATTFRTLEHNRPMAVDGLVNTLQSAVIRMAPSSVSGAGAGAVFRRR